MANTDDNDLHELRFDNVEAPPSSMFSLGPPSATDPVDDSGMIDDNDLTTSLLPRQGEDNAESGGLNASQIVAAASRPHSGVRLVMRKIGNFLATFSTELRLNVRRILALATINGIPSATTSATTESVIDSGTDNLRKGIIDDLDGLVEPSVILDLGRKSSGATFNNLLYQ